ESYIVTSCPNKDPKPITADLLLSEFDLDTISDYEGIVIPSGGQWAFLENDTAAHELLQVAYNNGLVIGTICNGGIAMVRSNIITDGTKVVSLFPRLLEQLSECGAIIEWNARVVSDNRIVTGNYGDYEIAPVYEVCVEMMKTIGGYSLVSNAAVSLENNGQYQITVEIANLSQDLPNLNITDIEQVIANIHPESNSSDVLEVVLTQIEDTNQYSADFVISDIQKYVVDLDVWSEDSILEVAKNATTFLDDVPDNGSQLNMILLVGGGAGTVVLAISIIVFLKKKS
ncbi:MAG: DJ-1/PfpI family protein, partial [Candidatus Thorarchaeota archaeon]